MADITTETIPVSPEAPEPGPVARAAEVLRRGGLVAFPTETVYGLGADARSPAAVARIFAAKGRPATDPLIVHLADAAEVGSVALDVPESARLLAERFWPGPLTLVLRRGPSVAPAVSAGLGTVAVRVPAHPIARALIAAAGAPVAAPSANRFSRPSPTTAAHVLEDLAGRVEIVLDGGPTAIGLESTVLDLTGPTPALLRPGGVPLDALRAAIGEVTYTPRYLTHESAASAPGGLLRHYAPDAELWLVSGPGRAARDYIVAEAERLGEVGRRVGVLALDEDMAALAGSDAQVLSLGSERDLAGVARDLFARIRAIDAAGVEIILVRGLPREGLGLAIWDRLVRAAEGRVVEVG